MDFNQPLRFPDILIVTDRAGFIQSVSGSSRSLTGMGPKDLQGASLSSLLQEPQQTSVARWFRAAAKEEYTDRAEIKNKTTGKTEAVALKIVDAANACVALISRATEDKNSPGHRLSEVSHELRNPLNSIIGLSNLLLQKNPRKDQLELINTLRFSAENLQALINDILDYSKIGAGKIQIEQIDFNLELLLKSLRISFKDAAESKGVRLSVNIRGEAPLYVRGDSTRLSQILYNLVSNAIKFTNQGAVSLEVSSKETDKGYEIRFKVTDTGIGIPENKIAEIFQPYQQAGKDITRKFGGTGLGLSIIKKLVEIMDGQIKVTSKEGSGSTFLVVLPFGKARTAKAKAENQSFNVAHINDAKLLYVEDIKSNQLLVREYCAIAKIQSDFAFDGKEAMEKLKDKDADLILLDLNLPGEDGFEIARKIRNLPEAYYKNIPIIAVTAENTYQVKNKIRNFGFNDIILKPINPDELFQKITQYLGAPKMNKQMKAYAAISKVNLKLLDVLYQGKPEEYISLLNLMMNEYRKYRKTLLFSVKHRDLKGYRKIVHNMRSNLTALGMNEFLDCLNDVKRQLQESAIDQDLSQASDELSEYFKEILQALDQKIRDLSSASKKA